MGAPGLARATQTELQDQKWFISPSIWLSPSHMMQLCYFLTFLCPFQAFLSYWKSHEIPADPTEPVLGSFRWLCCFLPFCHTLRSRNQGLQLLTESAAASPYDLSRLLISVRKWRARPQIRTVIISLYNVVCVCSAATRLR